MIWILHAQYAAKPLEQKIISDVFHQICSEMKARIHNARVRIDEVSSKKELLTCIDEIRKQDVDITQWHVVGYGMPYGPLLGSPEWPEEISAHEWAAMQIPFAVQAQAWLYMEGSAGWLAPFIATTFKITAYGCDHLDKTNLSGMRAFSPGYWNDAADYNPIASLYAEAFADITVRRDELRWIEKKLLQHKAEKVLDIGCGNGALLAHLSAKTKQGIGVDISGEAIRIAAGNNHHLKNLSFSVIEGPRLPLNDHSVDTILSLLSFRYLDWEPILDEMKRVLQPGGHILIVDMLASRPKLYEWPMLLTDKLKNLWYLRNRQNYTKALRALVTHPAWRKMIERHPMRSADAFVLYLKSRFPDGAVKVLNRGIKAKILSFDSGPVGGRKG